MAPRVSIVVPVLNEAATVGSLLLALQAEEAELIVVDGGSQDNTCAVAQAFADCVLQVEAGRARQMNAGAGIAQGEWLWFVHADTALQNPVAAYLGAITSAGQWGFFTVQLSSERPVYRIIEWFMNRRSQLTAVATGDQGLFVRRDVFSRQGGFAEQPLMEDVELSKCLRSGCKPSCSDLVLQTSSRRWEQRGVVRTVMLMWRLRLCYFLGASPQWLARQYR